MTQKYFAVIDPNWGEPRVLTSTISEIAGDAWEKAIHPQNRDRGVSLYSGASELPLPGGTPGQRASLEAHGYVLREITITQGDISC